MHGKRGLDTETFDAYIAHLYNPQETLGKTHEAAAVAAATPNGTTPAIHYDTTVAQVATSAAYGITLEIFQH